MLLGLGMRSRYPPNVKTCRPLRYLAASLLLATPLAATDWYVSPSGDNASSGTTSANAWKSITFAVDIDGLLGNLTPAQPGDTIHLLSGTYHAATGESFPIVLPEGISLTSTNNAAVTISLSGAADRTVAVRIPAGATTEAMAIGKSTYDTNGSFTVSGFTENGLLFDGSVDALESVVVRGVALDGGGGVSPRGVYAHCGSGVNDLTLDTLDLGSGGFLQEGVLIVATTGATLSGGVLDSTVDFGGTGITIEVQADDAADGQTAIGSLDASDTAATSSFEVKRNAVSNGWRGIELRVSATGDGSALCAPHVSGNRADSNSDTGILFQADSSGLSGVGAAEVRAWIAYNQTDGNDYNLRGEAFGDGQGFGVTARATPHLIGNNAQHAGSYGVHLTALGGEAAGATATAYMGGAPAGTTDPAYAAAYGMNVIRNNGSNGELLFDQTNGVLHVENNFWVNLNPADQTHEYNGATIDYTPVVQGSYLNGSPIGSPDYITAGPAGAFVLDAGVDGRFIDNPDSVLFVGVPDVPGFDPVLPGRLHVFIDGQWWWDNPEATSVTVSADGTELTLVGDWAELQEHFVQVNDPFDNGSNVFKFIVSEDGDPGGGEVGGVVTTCFVATAVSRGADTPEVRLLRRFRDERLLPLPGGPALVAGYYASSPPFADWLVCRPAASTAIRIALMPALGLARLLLDAPWVLLLLVPPLLLYRRTSRLRLSTRTPGVRPVKEGK